MSYFKMLRNYLKKYKNYELSDSIEEEEEEFFLNTNMK